MAKLSITQAAKEWGISRSTLQRRIKSGDVSVTQSDTGVTKSARTVDTAEMLRVFGEAKGVSVTQSEHVAMGGQTHLNDTVDQVTKKLINQLENENQFLRDQVEKLSQDLREIRKPILPKLLPWLKS